LLLRKLVAESATKQFVLITRPNQAFGFDVWQSSLQTSPALITKDDLRLDERDLFCALERASKGTEATAKTLLELTGGYPAGVHFALAMLSERRHLDSTASEDVFANFGEPVH